MKIGIYTDCHYSSAELTCERRHNNKSLRKIREAYDFFIRSGCDLTVCLGDMIDTEKTAEEEIRNLGEIAKIIHKCNIPTICLMGNHDAFVLERKQFYGILGIDDVSEMIIDGKKLLFLDACFFKSGKHYLPGDSDWTDTFFPDEEGLGAELKSSKEDVYIFIHQNIDPAVMQNHRLFNADRLFKLINESGVVKTVFQGHFHPGRFSEYGGVKYITLAAMCENEDAFWVYEL